MADYSLKQPIRQLLDFLRVLFRRVGRDRLPRHAASLAFSSLLALAPMMAIALSMLGLFTSFDQMGQAVETFIYSYLVPAASDEVKLYLDQFAGQAGRLTAVGLVFFLLTALLLLASIESSFNDILGVEKGRPLSARLTVYWALVSLGPLLMGASLSLSTYVLSLSLLNKSVSSVGLILLPIVLEVAAFLILYLIMPNVRVRFKHALIGAIFAALLFEFCKRGFGLYISNFNNYEVVYGALASLPIFLIWVYLSWLIALMGAELVATLRLQTAILEKSALAEKDEL